MMSSGRDCAGVTGSRAVNCARQLLGTEAAARRRGIQDGDSRQEDLNSSPPGLQESFPERSFVGGPEQEKESGAAVVQAFCGRLYRPHHDGELPVSGGRPGGGERARVPGAAHAACVWVGGWVPGLWVCGREFSSEIDLCVGVLGVSCGRGFGFCYSFIPPKFFF